MQRPPVTTYQLGFLWLLQCRESNNNVHYIENEFERREIVDSLFHQKNMKKKEYVVKKFANLDIVSVYSSKSLLLSVGF